MIAIVDYGLGNLRSVKYALDRLGRPCALTSDAGAIASADGVILPGVGAFERAMANLRDLDLVGVLRDSASAGRPLLGICLGLQLLFDSSDEHGRHAGLGILPGQVVRFGDDLTVPHKGWNQVAQAEALGAGEILLTSIDADGHAAGYDIELTAAVADAASIPVIASGGAGGPEDIFRVLTEGRADAALAASIFHYGRYRIADVKRYLAGLGVPVRV